jgi:hypothetical protein
LCAIYGVKRLELFRSASRSDFDRENSVWDIVQNKLPGLRQEIAEIKLDFGIE